ncbi:MAG TPA: CPBP family intramembrane glutamic endopeptidase [Thermodesulfobacteriota bacterium]|nr:CPBP family intramembrane glutamic endopeptidase [Thermodesulfobacteriota bacterium]
MLNSPRLKLLLLTLLVEGAVLAAALVLAAFFEIRLFPLTKNFFRDVLLGVFWTLLPLGLFIFAISAKAEWLPLLRSVRRIVLTDIKELISSAGLIDLVLISALAGFAEELLFRGVIQVKLGIFAASIIFGLFHFISPGYVIIATIMGFYIGVLFSQYESLLVPVGLHFLYDLGALVYLRYFVRG